MRDVRPRYSTDLEILSHKKIEPNEPKLMEASSDGASWNVMGVTPVSIDAIFGMDMWWERKRVVLLFSTVIAPELVF